MALSAERGPEEIDLTYKVKMMCISPGGGNSS